jgi:hypothetical protein
MKTPSIAPPLPLHAALAAALCLVAFAAPAQDRADIDKTQVIGNRELPKVLYIVPWKKPLPGQLSGRPVHSVLDEALAPVDRDVFRRQVNYSGQVQAQLSAKQEQAGTKAADNLSANPKPISTYAPAPTGAPR